MNNSLDIDLSEIPGSEIRQEALRERDSKLVRVIEALDAIIESNEWRTLKEEVFDEVHASVERRLQAEANKSEVALPELYRLQGERKWAMRFAKLEVLRSQYRTELTSIRKIIPGGGAP